MEINFNKRLAGVEDIDLDSDGSGASREYTFGTETYTVSAVNASHIPITAEARLKFAGDTNVDQALIRVYDMVFSAANALAEDTVVPLSSGSGRGFQAVIDEQPRNLGGHTLTFSFSDTTVSLADSIVFRNFYNGKVILTGVQGTVVEYQSREVYMQFISCSSSVEVSGIGIRYGRADWSSRYGLFFSGCPSGDVNGISFTGHEHYGSGDSGYDCYCVGFLGGDVSVTNCTHTVLSSDGSGGDTRQYASVVVSGNVGSRLDDVDSTVSGMSESVTQLGDKVKTISEQVVGDVDRNYMVVWGKNTNGEFGAGKKTSLGFTCLGYPLNCLDASFDGSNGIAIFNGKVYTTGLNTNNQLGLVASAQTGWMQQNDFGDWTDCEVCNGSCAAIRNKTLYCWGNNKWGQLGDGTTEKTSLPKRVLSRFNSSLTNFTDDWQQVEVGPGHMLAYARGASGMALYSCGNNKYGQLGQGTASGTKNLTVIPEDMFRQKPTTSFSAGGRLHEGDPKGFSAAISDTLNDGKGQLYTWGKNECGVLCRNVGGQASQTTPGIVDKYRDTPSGTEQSMSNSMKNGWVKVSCGARHITALQYDGTVFTAGAKEAFGPYGSSTGASNQDRLVRMDLSGLNMPVDEKIVDVKCGYDVTFLLSNKGNVYGYGLNANYSMGVKSANPDKYCAPRLIGTGANAIRSGCQCYGGCFISTALQRLDGMVADYDINVSGLSVSAANGRYTPTDTTATGTERVWGNGTYIINWDGTEMRWQLKLTDNPGTLISNQEEGTGEPTEGTWTNSAVVTVYEDEQEG